MATIEQLRSIFGGGSDAVTIQRASQKLGIPIEDIASEVGFDTGGKWGNRASASIDSAQASLLGVGEALTGSATLRNMREANNAEANAARQIARSKGAIMDSSQVEGFGTGLEFIGGLAVDNAPQLAATGLAGLAAGPWGAGTVGYTFALGDVLENQREQAGTTDLRSAALLAAPYAAVDTFTGIGGAVTRRALPKAGLNLLDKTLDGVQGIKGAALRTGVNVGKTSVIEGAGETFQEGMNQLGRMAVDPNETFLNDRSAEAFKESFIGGAALGGAFGSVGGWRRSDSYRPPAAPIDENGGVNLLNGQPLNPPAPVVNPGANAPLADVINQRVGLDLSRKPTSPKTYAEQFTAAQDEPSGVMAVDPATGQEYELTQAQYLEREAAQRNDTFAQQIAAEEAALAEDKAKIEARNAVREEAKGLGITGSKGADLYLELKQALEDGVISEADFRETRVQLGERKNNQVAKFIKAAYAQADATQTAKAQMEADAIAAVQAKADAQPEGVDTLEQDIQTALAARQGEVTGVQAREVQPVASSQVPERRNWSDAPGAVAGIAPDKTKAIGRSDRKKDLNPAQVMKKIKAANQLDKMRILAATGMDMVADPTTGAPKLVISGNPMTFQEIADAEAEQTGKQVSRQAIAQALAKFGVNESVATQVASTGNGQVYTEADLEIGPTEEGVADASGFRIEDTASKATNQGVIYDEVTGNAELTKVANALLQGKMTPEAAAQAVDGKTSKTTAARDVKPENAVTTAVEMPTTDTTKSDTVVTDLRENNDPTIQANIRAILASDEAIPAAADWGSTTVPWGTLPDTLKADWVEEYADIVAQFDGDLNQAAYRLLDAIQANIEDRYSDYVKNKGAQESAPAVPGVPARPQEVARLPEPANEARPTAASERVGGPAVEPVSEPVENTSAEDQRVAQENAAKAKVVVKKKRTIQKPVEAEPATEVVPTAPQILENLERLTSGTQPLVGESTRAPSVSRQVRMLLSKLDSGEISAEAFANRLEMAVNAADRARDSKPVTGRVRGADYFRQKLLEAKRRGDLSEEAVDLAEWFIQGNPALLDDVGISVRSSKNDNVSGFYDTMRRVVSLVKESGNAETAVHELLHHFERMMPAPVQDAIRKSWLNSLAKGIATAKKSGNADLVSYYQHLSDFHLGGGAQSSLKAAQQLLKDGKVPYEHYASINASEFWAVNGSAIVAGRFKASQSVLGRLRNWLSELGQKIKAAFGLQSDAPIIRALDSLAKSDGKFVSDSMLAKADSYNNVTQSVAQQLGPQYAKAESVVKQAIGDLKTAAVKYGAFTRDLIDQAAKYMPAARQYLANYEAVATDRTRMEQKVDAILERFGALSTHERTRVNELIRTSTMSKEWAFKPDWLKNAKYDENSDVAKAFRAMTPAQRGAVQDVFRHGYETLEAMQKAVTDNVNSEFDVLIKGFKDAGNDAEAAKAEARKAKALQEFSSMLEMNGNWPYAPLRRFGDHVVVAKSAAYRAAEKAKDAATIKKLEADENHYYVEFFESRGEARKKVADMQASGKYAGGVVENFNKGEANEQLYGGRDTFNAFRRLRNLVNETGGASLTEPANATINSLMNDLYLSLLGERSARQAERNRKNTAGADRDMMRAFATKGRADAHFIASLRFGGQVQEDLLKMKDQADNSEVGTRELRREFFNEILARHTMQMDFQSTPVVDKVMSFSSFFQLLVNPAHYLQNVMQPWVMSLPMLAGKHGYGKSWSALSKAYRDLLPLLKDGNFSKGDYDALPRDVQAIVKELAARGRIEISLEHDLGRWRSNADDGVATRYFVAAREKLRKANTQIEMVNRLATAIAAARLEGVGNAKAATDYADRVIIGTHGDYNAFNAPRLMRTPLGRMATQFRKFQLIQITMYTKLISDAFKGASVQERQAARLALAYNVGHMAALGGAMGLPGFQLFALVMGSLPGDDEPDDPEATMRRVLGNGPLADLLTRGTPNMLGVDLSGKVGSGNMLSLFPYSDWDVSSRDGYMNLLAAAAGPFVGGLLPRMAEGVGNMSQGDYLKGLEKFLPGAIGNAIKGTRFAVEGVTTTKGDMVMSPDEVTWVDGLFQAAGLPTSTLTERNFRSSAEYKASKFFDEKSSEIKRSYVEAFQDNDTEAMAEARQDWLDMQATRRRLGMTVQPLSQLIKAPQEQRKRERAAVGGVATDRETQGFVRQFTE